MPSAPLRPCNEPGCGELVSSGRCAGCKLKFSRFKGSSAQRGYDHTWRKLRLIVLSEEPLCQICLKRGIVKPSEQVDHIIPLEERPDLRLVRSNLQGVCAKCNREKARAQQLGQLSNTIIVFGPPCAGKNFYVDSRWKQGDLLIDYDAIMVAISGKSIHVPTETHHWFTYDAVQALISRLHNDGFRSGIAWIITAGFDEPKLKEMARALQAELILVNPGLDKCLERASFRPRPEETQNSIGKWYQSSSFKALLGINNIPTDSSSTVGGV